MGRTRLSEVSRGILRGSNVSLPLFNLLQHRFTSQHTARLSVFQDHGTEKGACRTEGRGLAGSPHNGSGAYRIPGPESVRRSFGSALGSGATAAVGRYLKLSVPVPGCHGRLGGHSGWVVPGYQSQQVYPGCCLTGLYYRQRKNRPCDLVPSELCHKVAFGQQL